MRLLKVAIAAAVSLAIAAGAFAGGIAYERKNPFLVPVPKVAEVTDAPKSGAIGSEVERVKTILDREALRPSSESTMTRGAIEGMLRSLEDSYAAYFDTKSFERFTEHNKGEIFGIGINVTVRDGQPVVVSPMKGTPAAKAGLKADDRIVSIDGQEKDQWEIEQVVNLIRGPEGTRVKLEIKRKGEKANFFRTIRRAKIDLPNYESEMIGKDIGYIRLFGFTEVAAEQVQREVESLAKKGAKGYIIDVRDNPGGLLGSAVDISSLFVEDGAIVRVEARNQPEEVYRANGQTITGAPLVVLINENSASASEILAGALQDHDRATIVGVKSYGKGSVQTVRELSKGSAIKFTMAHYLTPSGRSIDRKGVVPDVKVPMKFQHQVVRAKDVQLKRATEILREKF